MRRRKRRKKTPLQKFQQKVVRLIIEAFAVAATTVTLKTKIKAIYQNSPATQPYVDLVMALPEKFAIHKTLTDRDCERIEGRRVSVQSLCQLIRKKLKEQHQ
ncbi:MAG: hypothetical protein PHC61_11905 [Chitinivibrionales bacterium]|nr:hypothetical protein [Chitinivibrionales bacterium]